MNEVKFNLKNATHDQTLIVMVYRHNSNRIVMSTGISIPPSHWNRKKQRVREVAGQFEYPAYNNILNTFDKSVRKSITEFSNRGQNPTPLQLKAKIKEHIQGGNIEKSKSLTVLKYAERFIEKGKVNEIRSEGTQQGYRQMKTVIKTFRNGSSLEFADLDLDQLNALTRHMVTKHKYSTNQINKIQRRLLTVAKEAKIEGYIINEAINASSWRVSMSSINDKGIALTNEEIELIKSAELPIKLDKVRDKFLLGTSVGQRYSDFNELSQDNVIENAGKKYFNIVQKKTGKVVKIPLNKLITSILKKYDGYPPVISSQRFNEYLKDMCKIAGINEEVIVRKENPIQGIISEERIPKHRLISSHDCRRTFATLAHLKGVPAGLIMKITGHSNLKSFSTYLKINLEEFEHLTDQLDFI